MPVTARSRPRRLRGARPRARAPRRGAVVRRPGTGLRCPAGGYHIGAAAASFLAITADTVFGWDEHTRPLVRRPDGSPLHAGDLVRSPDLADTLDLIGEQGHRTVYTGELAERIAADSVARGAHHGGRPRGIPGGGPHPTAAEGRRLGLATNPRPPWADPCSP